MANAALRTVLTSRVKNLLLPNKLIKDKISVAMGVHALTVHRWVQVCDEEPTALSQPDAMKVIREETGLTDDLILTTTSIAA